MIKKQKAPDKSKSGLYKDKVSESIMLDGGFHA